MFITNDAAKNDLACQIAMANYAKQLQAEEQYRKQVREGKLPAPSWNSTEVWNISDRHWCLNFFPTRFVLLLSPSSAQMWYKPLTPLLTLTRSKSWNSVNKSTKSSPILVKNNDQLRLHWPAANWRVAVWNPWRVWESRTPWNLRGSRFSPSLNPCRLSYSLCQL